MRDDLQYDLCSRCGSYHVHIGLIPTITNECASEMVVYRMAGGMSFMRMWNDILAEMSGGRRSMQDFYDLLKFDTFKAMPNFETASYMDKFIYSVCRDADVAAMKRLRAYVELEEDFNAKY
jgi:hypothetical protein